MLEPAELTLDGRAAPVEALPAQSLARDEGMQPVSLDPDRRVLALAGRAAPVGCINSIVLVGAGVLGLIEPVMSLALSTRRRGPVLASLLYVMCGRLTALVLLCFRSSEYKELEIVVLRHEIAVLRRQISRPAIRPAEREPRRWMDSAAGEEPRVLAPRTRPAPGVPDP